VIDIIQSISVVATNPAQELSNAFSRGISVSNHTAYPRLLELLITNPSITAFYMGTAEGAFDYCGITVPPNGIPTQVMTAYNTPGAICPNASQV
jgi:hypothetical protein